MTKKNAIIILGIIVALAIIVVAFLLLLTNKSKEVNDNSSSTSINGDIIFPEIGDRIDMDRNQNNNQNNQGQVVEGVIPKLRQISFVPSSGYTHYDRNATEQQSIQNIPQTETETVFRYVERATGNIYETTSRSLAVSRITNTTIPKIHEALFFDKGDGVILRYIGSNGSIESYIAKVTKKATSTEILGDESEFSELQGTFLPQGIEEIIKSPTEDRFLYTRMGRFFTFNAITPQNQTAIFESPIIYWAIDWIGNNLILQTKSNAFEESLLFTTNTSGADFKTILDDAVGMTSKVSPDLKTILYSSNINSRPTIHVYDIDKKERKVTGIYTLADKCVFSKLDTDIIYCAVPTNLQTNNYPDAWYQGIVSFNDDLYKINMKDGNVVKLDGVQNIFDITNLTLTGGEDYLVFMNKKDLTIWSLDIKN